MIPPLIRVIVLSHDPENDGMVVMAVSGQMPAFTVKRLYMGAADSHRFNKPPLPPRGTYGLVATVGGDPRNMMWLGAYHPNLVDAIPNTQDDPFSEYHSHFSGHWSYVDGLSGYVSQQFADGSFFTASSGVSLQTVYRHIVDQNQNRKQVPFTFPDRNPKPQPTFAYTFVQSGSNFSGALSPSGSLNITWNQGQTITIMQSGTGASIFIDGQGNIMISATSGNGTITLNAPKQLTINTPLAQFTGDIKADGEIIAKDKAADIHLSTHTHDSVQSGSDHTSKPDQGT